jgi:hypothetical protein
MDGRAGKEGQDGGRFLDQGLIDCGHPPLQLGNGHQSSQKPDQKGTAAWQCDYPLEPVTLAEPGGQMGRPAPTRVCRSLEPSPLSREVFSCG